MFASVEKKLIEKKYNENLNGAYIWAYYKNINYLKNIDLKYDLDRDEYIFSFPLNGSKFNYKAHFKYFDDMKRYVNYIVFDYL